MTDKIEGVVQRVGGEIFTEEALRAQEGKQIPVTLDDGEIIGVATLHFDEGEKALMATLDVEDPEMAELLKGPIPFTPPSIIFGYSIKKETNP